MALDPFSHVRLALPLTVLPANIAGSPVFRAVGERDPDLARDLRGALRLLGGQITGMHPVIDVIAMTAAEPAFWIPRPGPTIERGTKTGDVEVVSGRAPVDPQTGIGDYRTVRYSYEVGDDPSYLDLTASRAGSSQRNFDLAMLYNRAGYPVSARNLLVRASVNCERGKRPAAETSVAVMGLVLGEGTVPVASITHHVIDGRMGSKLDVYLKFGRHGGDASETVSVSRYPGRRDDGQWSALGTALDQITLSTTAAG